MQAGHDLAARLEGVAQDLLDAALASPGTMQISNLRVSRCCSLVVQLLEHGLEQQAVSGWIPYMQAPRPTAFDMLQVNPSLPTSISKTQNATLDGYYA